MIQRIMVTVGLVALALWAPWPMLFLGIMLATLLIEDYYEGVAIGLFFDLLYGNSGVSRTPLATLLALGALGAGPFLRAHIRWYS